MQIHSMVLATAMLLAPTAGQAQDYMDTMAKAACECAARIPESTPARDLKAQAGICLLRAMPPYKDKLKADFGVDLDNLGKDGERMGQLVGSRMAQHCPATLVKLSRITDADKPAVVETTVEGVVTRIEKDFFVVFSLKDGAGKTVKLYWMSPVASSIDLVNGYEGLLGKSIKASYQPKDFFDPKVNDYRQFNLISRIW